ncbi:NHLP bacteriocin export ABC transporter permease/ATPase subunit [Rhodospirillum sp. A1_3_36]|uniref:NHLP bacteriocin export ABC transporter permease/ATPase subunit n=1 Tax=Rhodospirillum sp. A1_3_36 TaxID=3391666 RepID=UPI0039A49627
MALDPVGIGRAGLPGGRERSCPANAPIDGDDPQRVWVVLQGSVNLFAVRREPDGRDGPRHPLFRVDEGGLVFGLPPIAEEQTGAGQPVHLVFCGDPDARVHEISVDALFGERRKTWSKAIDAWVGALSSALLDLPDAWPVRVAEEPGFARLGARESLFGSPRAILWAEGVKGRARWQGRGGLSVDLEEGRILPLSAGVFLQAEGSAEVSLDTTITLMGEDRLARPLADLHRLAGQRLTAWVADCEGQEHARLADRLGRDQRVWDHTLRRAAAVLSQGPSGPGLAPTRASSPLVDVFRQVALAEGVTLDDLEPPPPQGATAEDRVQALARSAGARVRRVLLRGEWWKTDAGPLIAFLGGDRAPVALLPHGPDRYHLVDPSQGTPEVLSETLAQSLSADAFALYSPLRADNRRVRDLVGLSWRKARPDLARGSVMGLLAALLALITPIVTGYLIDNVIPRAEIHRVGEAGIALVVIALGASAFRAIQAVGLLRAEGRIDWVGQSALFQRLLTLPTGFFRGYAIGDLADRCLGFQHIRSILTGNTLQALSRGVFSMGSLALLYYYNWRLALIACATLLVVSVLMTSVTIAQRRARAEMVGWQGRIDGLTVQLLSAIAKLRVAAAEDRAFTRWFSLVVSQKECLKRAQLWANVAETLSGVVPVLCTGVLFLSLSMILDDLVREDALSALLPPDPQDPGAVLTAMTTGDFLAFNAAFGQALAGFLLLARAFPEVIEIGPHLDRLRPLLLTAPEAVGARVSPGSLSGSVAFNHVTFRYDEGSAPVVDDLNLQIESGSFVALVGPSGGGKSTLIRLLLGFETPEVGNVVYDDKPLDQLDLSAVRTQIGVVLQNGRINQGSVAEAIVGTSGASLEDAWVAARMTGLASEIEAMPMGMHTVLLDGAQTLSGGQRQRLMLARALVGRPRLLILDEATSALDNRTQEIVTTSLERLRCTRIVIAHRLSTIMKADKIIVIDEGRIIEVGTYDDLMDMDGPFRALAHRQLM